MTAKLLSLSCVLGIVCVSSQSRADGTNTLTSPRGQRGVQVR